MPKGITYQLDCPHCGEPIVTDPLTPTQRKYVEEVARSETQAEAARKLGVTRQAVNDALTRLDAPVALTAARRRISDKARSLDVKLGRLLERAVADLERTAVGANDPVLAGNLLATVHKIQTERAKNAELLGLTTNNEAESRKRFAAAIGYAGALSARYEKMTGRPLEADRLVVAVESWALRKG